MGPNETEIKFIVDTIPIIKDGKNKSLLYIGANCPKIFFYDELLSYGYKITILEIWAPNVEFYKKQGYNIISGDINNLTNIFKTHFDVSFWWHGPEHIEKENLPMCLEYIENISSLIVVGCPFNENEDDFQKEVYGNIYEKHRWSVKEYDLINLGYQTSILDRSSYYHCDNLISWKYKK